jgi:hypothetical protein
MVGVLDFATDALLEVSPCDNGPTGMYFPDAELAQNRL